MIKNARHRRDDGPIEADCSCPTCRTFSRAYLRHLFLCGEMLASRLMTVHNLHHYLRTMQEMREAIAGGTFAGLLARSREQRQREASEDAGKGQTT